MAPNQTPSLTIRTENTSTSTTSKSTSRRSSMVEDHLGGDGMMTSSSKPNSVLTEPLLPNGHLHTMNDDDDDDTTHHPNHHPNSKEPLAPWHANDEPDTVSSSAGHAPPNHPPVSNIENTTATTTTTTNTITTNSTAATTISHWRKNVLALSSTTHCVATLLIPLLILATHVLFLYGQTSDMWSLRLSNNDIDVAYHATTYESQFTLDALKLPRSYQYHMTHEHRNVRTFTYMYAMQELWEAKHMPGLFLPRLASAGLFLFSGIWPHLKLLLLNLTWCTPYTNHIRRQRMLSYLSVLGKWSLVDVLVVCVMVGVLHLQYTFTAPHVMEMIQSHLHNVVTLVHTMYNDVQLCSMALKYSCDHPKNVFHIADCTACRNIVKTWFGHPDSVRDVLKGMETSGGGAVQLSVVGLHGIYAFCGAVIASILLSFVVDYYDFQCRTFNHQHHHHNESPHTSTDDIRNDDNDVPHNETDGVTIPDQLSTEVTTIVEDCDDAILNQLLLAAEHGNHHSHRRNTSRTTIPAAAIGWNGDHIDTRSMADRDFDRTIRIENHRHIHVAWHMVSWMTLLVVIGATLAITMERRVYGAIPMLLQETFDVVWTKQYNFIWLAYTTALAGQWDYLLMGTFVWFVIAGPILRAALCVIASRYNETSTMTDDAIVALYRTKRHLSTWIDFIGAFCAWEVFTVAVLMVDLLMPSITSTILIDPRCAQIISTNTTDSAKNSNCFEVEFDIVKNTFWMVIAGGAVLLLVSQNIRNNLHRTER